MSDETLRLGVLDGDGIGPEIVPAAVAVADAALRAARVPVEWLRLPVGHAAIRAVGEPIPAATIAALERLDGWLLGPHDSASYDESHRAALSPTAAIRKHFDLFANIRPAKAFAGTAAVAPDIDVVIVRENTEGFYPDRSMHRGQGEFMPTPDSAITVGLFTRAAVERVARVAFEIARTRRGHVTVVHKANVLRLTTGLFRDVCLEVAAAFPEVEVDDAHVDAMAAHLVRRSGDFDVIVTENLFGDILSDLAGELAGSLGIAASLNASAAHAMAQASHGSAPDIAMRGIANPVAMMLSTAMLLDWLADKRADKRLRDAAANLRRGITASLGSGVATPDLGGTASTAEFTAVVIEQLEGNGGRASGRLR